MFNLILVVSLFLNMFGASPPVLPACTSYLTAPGPIPPWIAPGTVLCLHGGTYPHGAIDFTTNNGTYQAVPGETPVLVANNGASLSLYGHDITLSGLTIDNSGIGIPAVVIRGAHDTLLNNIIFDGKYNGVDVRGTDALIQGNHVHNFDAWDGTSTGGGSGDADCLTVFRTADRLRILNNTLHDCSGNGVEFTQGSTLSSTVWVRGALIDGNTVYRGTIPRAETGLGLKQGEYVTITNNYLSGYSDHNWALGARGQTRHIIMANNIITSSYTGIVLGLLDGGFATDVTVSGNTVDGLNAPFGVGGGGGQTGGGWSLELSGCVRCDITNNVFKNSAFHSVFVESNGLKGGNFSGNVIVNAPAPQLYPGSYFVNVTVGPNSWYGSPSGFLGRSGDTVGSNATATQTPTLIPSPTENSTPTPTVTPTFVPTITPTDTPTATDTPVPVPTLSGCWDLRQQAPISIPCPATP